MMKCSCGGTFLREEGLNGFFCDRCGAYSDSVPDNNDSESRVEKSYTEEKLKAIRGVPVNRIIFGSESKGRVEISVPIFASKEEQKQLIDQQLSLLQYAKQEAERRNLDIMPKR